ncbi:MAG: PAS domain-containing sensor histidine kinase, partial [Thermodesulfobacteriota bacterium]|nr:PAS domain-containing sensor histidine kinase [Thermodesulfobacteriota bacterium]
ETLVRSPKLLLSVLVLAIFFLSLGVMTLLHKIPDLSHEADILMDSMLMVLLLYPCLVLLLKRPYLIQIQAREQTEEALYKTESRLRMILDNNPYFMAVRNEEGVVLLANRRYAEFFGTSGDRIMGVPLAQLYEAADLDREEYLQTLAADREVIASGNPMFGRERVIERNGADRWFRVSRIPVTMEEGSRCVMMIAGEMTRQIRAEEVLHRAHDDLERRVGERTAELVKANDDLRQAVSAHMRAEEELWHYREQLQNLSAGLQALLEEERTRISREIHDELGQSLTALKFDLSAMGKHLPEGQAPLAGKTEAMVTLVDSILNTVKKISRELRPGVLDDLGLATAIEWQAKEFHGRTGIPCRVALFPRDMDIDRERSTAIFRIFQEALTNIVRHAGATKVEANLEERDGRLTLEVRDNGNGISKEQASGSKSLGLIGIRERVRRLKGEVLIDGSPLAGTVIRVTIPGAGARADVPSARPGMGLPSTGSKVGTT